MTTPNHRRAATTGRRLAGVLAALALLLGGCAGEEGGDDPGGEASSEAAPADGATSEEPTEGATSQAAGGEAASGEPVRLAVMLGLTGAYSVVGEPQQQAVDLFVEQVNAEGGIDGRPLEVEVVDTTSVESEAVNQYRRLDQEGEVIGVVGPSSSGEAVAMKPISTQLQLPMIAIAASNAIVDPVEPYAFKEFPASTDSLRAQLDYGQQQGWSSIAILYSNNAYGQEAAEPLPDLVGEYDLELVASESFSPEATDMTPQLRSIADAGPDAVLVWSVNPANAIIARNAAAIDFPGVVFQAPGAASAAYIELGEGDVEGTLVQASKILVPDDIPEDDPQFEAIDRFVSSWRDAYGGDPSQFAAGAWDAMLIAAEGLRVAELGGDVEADRQAFQAGLEGVAELPGTIAVYDFSGDVHGPEGIAGQAVLGVQDGAFVLEETADAG